MSNQQDLMPKPTLLHGMVVIMATHIVDTMAMEDTMATDMDMDTGAARNVRPTLLLSLPLTLHLQLFPILATLLDFTTLFPTPTLLLTKTPLSPPVKWKLPLPLLSTQVIMDMVFLMPTGVMDFPFLPNLLKNPQLLMPERNVRLRLKLILKLGIMPVMAII